MTVEYPVRVKFLLNPSELRKVVKNVTGQGGGKDGGKDDLNKDRQEKKKHNKTSLEILGGLLKKIGIIAAILEILWSVIQPILDVLNILVFWGVATIIKLLDKWFGGGQKKDKVDPAKMFEDTKKGLLNIPLPKESPEDQAARKAFWDNLFTSIGNWIKNAANSFVQGFIDTGIWLWNLLQQGWDLLKTFGRWIWDNVLVPGFSLLKNAGSWILDNIIIPGWNVMKSAGQWIWDNIVLPGWDFLKNVGSWLWNQIIKPAWDFLKDIGKWVWDQIVKPAFDALYTSLMSGVNLIKRVWDWITSLLPGGGKTGQSKAFGGDINQTGLYMLHAGETVNRPGTGGGLSKGNSISITVNVMGNASKETADTIARQIAQTMNTYGRW